MPRLVVLTQDELERRVGTHLTPEEYGGFLQAQYGGPQWPLHSGGWFRVCERCRLLAVHRERPRGATYCAACSHRHNHPDAELVVHREPCRNCGREFEVSGLRMPDGTTRWNAGSFPRYCSDFCKRAYRTRNRER